MSLTPAAEFERRVRDAFADSPYQVRSTDKGFDVQIDVADARWWGILNRAGLKYSMEHRVEVGHDSFKITDVMHRVEWVAGVPRIEVKAEKQAGRVIQMGMNKTWAFNDQGEFTKVVDYTFHSEEGRAVITDIGRRMGLRSRMSATTWIGLVVGVIGLIGALIAATWFFGALFFGWFGGLE